MRFGSRIAKATHKPFFASTVPSDHDHIKRHHNRSSEVSTRMLAVQSLITVGPTLRVLGGAASLSVVVSARTAQASQITTTSIRNYHVSIVRSSDHSRSSKNDLKASIAGAGSPPRSSASTTLQCYRRSGTRRRVRRARRRNFSWHSWTIGRWRSKLAANTDRTRYRSGQIMVATQDGSESSACHSAIDSNFAHLGRWSADICSSLCAYQRAICQEQPHCHLRGRLQTCPEQRGDCKPSFDTVPFPHITHC